MATRPFPPSSPIGTRMARRSRTPTATASSSSRPHGNRRCSSASAPTSLSPDVWRPVLWDNDDTCAMQVRAFPGAFNFLEGNRLYLGLELARSDPVPDLTCAL